MNDEHFETLMRDAARTYNTPPEPDFDAMWTNIASRMEPVVAKHAASVVALPTRRRAFYKRRPFQIAATLVLGIGLGRASLMFGHPSPANTPVVASTPVRDSAMARPYEVETSQYLGQTAALLVALPGEIKAGGTHRDFTAQASDLLTRTRLLLDSPASNDPNMRDLFEDLELVLIQVVRLQNNENRLDADLINRALEQRDVIPRLRMAAADISAN